MKTFVVELIDNAIGSDDTDVIYELPSMVIGIINTSDDHPKKSQIYKVLSNDDVEFFEAIITNIEADENDSTYFHMEISVPEDDDEGATEWTTQYLNMYEVPVVVSESFNPNILPLEPNQN